MTSLRPLCAGGIFVIAAILTMAGCNSSVAPAPVSVTYRPSLLGIGQVVVITNSSNHHLYNVTVVARSFKDVTSASVKATDHLTPGASVEVGWMQFGNWVPEPGETIEIYADGHLTPSLSVVPKQDR